MSEQEIYHKHELLEEYKIKRLYEEARLQYEKVYLELKRKILSNKANILKPQIERHNQKVVDYFERKLEKAVNDGRKKGVSFTRGQYIKLLKHFHDRLYIFD